ncbi:MAG: redox-regulated ATPase YchF [Nanoarchaeota archaeon]|nr:redox-regulated ATPase YchF [Nanoarchaeota archaeon]MBU1322155.1 redox-regulated ATPase YchF [Nanoarchaeota archaeon]MBU1597876.1 redox-regulated ATPase YchF [Nanoarchaeota archaeon]MBU2441295.1 redox-regulated ATPase YchF [Nanoarchaeota archaeon]
MIIGVVGKANVGKSTFFKAATLAEVEIANYPFVTIKPNRGMGFVRVSCVSKDFNVECKPRLGYCIDHERFVPVEFIDVAGLVPGAHEGKGMGNQFLNDLNQADALIHVIDVSGGTNEKGEPVEKGSYNPSEDVKFLGLELDHWYLNILKKGWDKLARQIQQEHSQVQKVLAKQLSAVGVNEELMKQALDAIDLREKAVIKWTDDDLFKIASFLRKKTKPMIIAANKIDVPGAKENFDRIVKEFSDEIIVACSAEAELALKEAHKHNMIKYIPGDDNFKILDESKINEKQKKGLEFLKTNVLQKFNGTGVQEVLNQAVFKLLKHIAVYPVANNKLTDKDGNVLPDCFLVPQGTSAIEFAYKVHTDIGDNFVKAINLKTKQPVSKNAPLNNHDVIEIMTSK